MENYPIKTVTFGGFDKQDVIQYIERAAQDAATAEQTLRAESEELRRQVAELTKAAAEREERLRELSARQEALQAELAREREARQELEPLRPLREEAEHLRAQVEALRPDAEAYAQFRERIGAIECEARKRAADLESAAAVRMEKTVELFRSRYQDLMSTFESAAAHVTGELRKVEVNLAQLPRAMDQAGVELGELAAVLEERRETD